MARTVPIRKPTVTPGDRGQEEPQPELVPADGEMRPDLSRPEQGDQRGDGLAEGSQEEPFVADPVAGHDLPEQHDPGVGLAPKVALVFTVVFFPVVVNTFAGVHAVIPTLIEVARSFDASRLQIVDEGERAPDTGAAHAAGGGRGYRASAFWRKLKSRKVRGSGIDFGMALISAMSSRVRLTTSMVISPRL
jgi:hypothetical protein